MRGVPTRRPAVLIALAIAAGSLASCGGHHVTDADRLRADLARTAKLSHRFVYSEVAGKTRIEVRGLVADDFRYKASTSVNGVPIWEEVVDDDALADRPLTNGAFTVFGRRAATSTGAVAATTAQGGATVEPAPLATLTPDVRDALLAHRWVLDPAGAPSLLPSATEHHPLGADPVFDSLTVFRYVEVAIRGSQRVHEFNADALDYKPREDPFPKPKKHSGVTRFDFDRPRLPRPQDVAGGGGSVNQAIPAVNQFRKMAVYVKHGLVIQVLEQIDVVSRLDELQRNYNAKIPSSLPEADRVKIAIDAINAVRVAQGNDPIRVRTMSMQLIDLGQPQTVALPLEAVQGSLAAFENRGRSTSSALSAAGGSVSPTTTATSPGTSTSTTAPSP